MEFPINLKCCYVGEGPLPIMTMETTHWISDEMDLDTVASFINQVSEYNWDSFELYSAIKDSEEKQVTNTEQDSCLHLYVF